MWHASTGDKTFTGPFGLLLAHGILQTIEEMNELHEIDEEFEVGIRTFDTLPREQNTWALHKVAFGLLDAATPMPELTAYLEATAAAVFGMIDAYIQMEQDDGECFWRKLVLAAYESIGRNRTEDLEGDEELLTAECNDINEWRLVLGTLEEQVFWDLDYTNDRMIDLAPEHAEEMRQMADAVVDYTWSIMDEIRRNGTYSVLPMAPTFNVPPKSRIRLRFFQWGVRGHPYPRHRSASEKVDVNSKHLAVLLILPHKSPFLQVMSPYNSHFRAI